MIYESIYLLVQYKQIHTIGTIKGRQGTFLTFLTDSVFLRLSDKKVKKMLDIIGEI